MTTNTIQTSPLEIAGMVLNTAVAYTTPILNCVFDVTSCFFTAFTAKTPTKSEVVESTVVRKPKIEVVAPNSKVLPEIIKTKITLSSKEMRCVQKNLKKELNKIDSLTEAFILINDSEKKLFKIVEGKIVSLGWIERVICFFFSSIAKAYVYEINKNKNLLAKSIKDLTSEINNTIYKYEKYENLSIQTTLKAYCAGVIELLAQQENAFTPFLTEREHTKSGGTLDLINYVKLNALGKISEISKVKESPLYVPSLSATCEALYWADKFKGIGTLGDIDRFDVGLAAAAFTNDFCGMTTKELCATGLIHEIAALTQTFLKKGLI